MAILADVAPYSREYNTYRQRVGKQAQGNTELEIEYEKILTRVKQTRESVIKMTDRHFTAPVNEISGTVEEVSPGASRSRNIPDGIPVFIRVDQRRRYVGADPRRTLGLLILADTKTLAHAPTEALHEFGLFLHLRHSHQRAGSMVSSSCRTQNTSRVRNRPPSLIRCLPLFSILKPIQEE